MLQTACNGVFRPRLRDAFWRRYPFRIYMIQTLQKRYNTAKARFDSLRPACERNNSPSMITLQRHSSTRFVCLLQIGSEQDLFRKNEGIDTVPVWSDARDGQVAISAGLGLSMT